MSLQNLLNQFIGPSGAAPASSTTTGQGISDTLSRLSGSIPGGLAGGAAAGGIVALLLGSKSARKFAGKTASYGGAAVLGGLAYKAWQQWQQGNTRNNVPGAVAHSGALSAQSVMRPPDQQQHVAELTLVRAMIAAAKADGHMDGSEQDRIFEAVEQMDLSPVRKGEVFDCLRQQISADQLAREVTTLEQKSELYLASCVVIDLDHPAERAYLDGLARALQLPEGLPGQLESQVRQAVSGPR